MEPKFEPKYAMVPWTTKFCLKIVLPVVTTSPKYVLTGISSKIEDLISVAILQVLRSVSE